jgi:predicted chitinase
MLTESQLRQIMPNLPAAKAAAFLPHLNDAMAEHAIESMLRTAAFVAQLAHESGEFRWMEEIWGPTEAQRNYEPVTSLSQRLGNIEPGDGKRFKGRGPIQLTGRANYKRFGELLGVNLAITPEQAAAPDVAFRIAALYWKSRGLNELADAQDFRTITKRINGGFNGLADRQKYYDRAKEVLATAFVGQPAPATRGGCSLRRSLGAPLEPLTRGFEAIQELSTPARRAKTSGSRASPARKRAAKKKGAVKKAPTKKAATRKAGPAKKAPAKKAPRRKPAARKAAASRRTPRKNAATRPRAKTPARKAAGPRRATQR